MALSWALACGFGGVLPYFYPAFFIIMITHRAGRDEKRCRDKYGADWDRYPRRRAQALHPVRLLRRERRVPVVGGHSRERAEPANSHASASS